MNVGIKQTTNKQINNKQISNITIFQNLNIFKDFGDQLLMFTYEKLCLKRCRNFEVKSNSFSC